MLRLSLCLPGEDKGATEGVTLANVPSSNLAHGPALGSEIKGVLFSRLSGEL